MGYTPKVKLKRPTIKHRNSTLDTTLHQRRKPKKVTTNLISPFLFIHKSRTFLKTWLF